MNGGDPVNYEIRSCSSEEAAYVEERFWEEFDSLVPAEKDAKEDIIVFKVTDSEGVIIAGCVLDIDTLKIAEFNSLWVDERYRRQGIGSALVCEAERAAAEKGCRVIYNNFNFDFQAAKPLFEKLGYAQCGVIKGWPKGHKCYHLVKALNDPATNDVSSLDRRYDISLGSDEDGEYIGSKLEGYNNSIVPRTHEYRDLNRIVTDEAGNVIGGCVAGVSGWDTAHIDMIWVDKRYRDHGIGTRLLKETELDAGEHGAFIALTGSIELQSGFMRKNGYIVEIIQEGHPEYFVMRKDL